VKYRFVLKKIELVSNKDDFDSQETIKNIIDRLSRQEELRFSEAEYHFEVMTDESVIISQIIWKSPEAVYHFEAIEDESLEISQIIWKCPSEISDFFLDDNQKTSECL